MIRNTSQKDDKNVLLQVSPEKIKKQQKNADRVIKELLEEDERKN